LKILIHSLNYKPELTGIGKYSGEMAEWLSNMGHEVRVITAPPYYPAWKIRHGYSAWSYKKEQIQGVAVYRCPIWVSKNVKGLNRIIHLASFAISSFFLLSTQIFWRPHVVLSVAPAFLASPFTLIYSMFTNAKTWLHIQDFEIDAAFSLGILKVSKLTKTIRYFERLILKKFDRISTISNQMIKNLRLKKIEKSKIFLFPNWADMELIHPLSDSNPMRVELGIKSDTIVALYSGNMGKKQGIEILVKVAQILEPYSHIKFIFCGEGSSLSRLKSMSFALSNVIFLPLQPVEKLNYLLNLADIHLLPQKKNVADLVMPSKLSGILASGKPVLATSKPGTEIAQAVRDHGVIVPPENEVAFSQTLLWLANHPEERTKLGQNGRIFAKEHLGKEKILSQFERNLFALINDKKVKNKINHRTKTKVSYQPENQYSTKHSI
jgi:colanic acid biosynthesis glycosyl transferase WcaI